MAGELKPCPFCGGPAESSEDTDGRNIDGGPWSAGCFSEACAMDMVEVWGRDQSEAEAKWNRRPVPVVRVRVREGERLEIRGSFTAEGCEPEYGAWGPATVTSQAKVAEPDTHFLVLTDRDMLLFRSYADEGKTWQRIPEVRRG